MASDYAQQLGSRLRSIRQQQGLSLHGVEEKSNGRWKAVVVGSYERGDRAVTVPKLADLADFYGVPLAELLPSSRGSASALEAVPKVTIDLNKLSELDQPEAAALGRYAQSIQSVRGDYNGKVLSIRKEDLRTLAVIYDEPMEQLTDRFIEWGVLNVDARGVARDDR